MPTDQDNGSERTGASPAAIISHYDMGDEFFRLVLGPEMIYSCATFTDGDDLATAQRRKLDHHINAAGISAGTNVLDVGCGWGAMLRRLVDAAGVASAVGLTLSPSQARWIGRSPRTEIEVLQQDWRDHKPKKPYDAIVSIGAFEHFVQKGLDPTRKLEAYREFFAFCDGVLATGGRLSLQTIAYSEPHKVHPLLEETFPESDLPLFWEPVAAAEGRFQLVSLRNDGDDYVRTLQMWERSLLDHYDEAVALVGDVATAKFRRYLRLSAVGFRIGMVGLLRMSFVKKY